MEIIKAIEGNDYIRNSLLTDEPFIVSKMGGVEQNIIISKMNNISYNGIRDMASNNAGITPSDDKTLDFFFNEYTKALENTNVLGSMSMPTEVAIISKYAPTAFFSELRLLEPFYFEKPWSESLKGKNVLVIHPFESTIINQYSKRNLLFVNKKILPEFNLLTIKAEQTNGGGTVNSKSFIESLNIMKDKMDKINFDVAIIGCGAYGLLLADYAKTKGKQAIHIGGGLQILFGIKGKRWDVHPEISAMYNEHWVRPTDNEKTINYHIVEGGTYW